MIHPALEYICTELSNYIKVKTEDETGSEKKVTLANLVKQDGSIDHLPEDKILCSLINVEEEKITNHQAFKYVESENGYVKRNADINLNLYILFVNHFKHYVEALKSLTHIVSFFQQERVFTPGLIQGSVTIQARLIFELHTPSFEQINQLWGALGAKYAPSLIYKMKMITITSDHDLEQVGIIGEDKILVGSRNASPYGSQASLDDLKEGMIQETLDRETEEIK
ncbi:Pvc16 family protein [Ekhidna sp.]